MVKTAFSITATYILFALSSTVINIAAQISLIRIYTGPYSVEISILAGTTVALPLRYFLEKRYIFVFKSNNIKHDSHVFALYSLMSVITTVIFWVTEYAFHLVYHTETMRYVGAVFGLGIGFYLKYQLDKKYVFVNSNKKLIL